MVEFGENRDNFMTEFRIQTVSWEVASYGKTFFMKYPSYIYTVAMAYMYMAVAW